MLVSSSTFFSLVIIARTPHVHSESVDAELFFRLLLRHPLRPILEFVNSGWACDPRCTFERVAQPTCWLRLSCVLAYYTQEPVLMIPRTYTRLLPS